MCCNQSACFASAHHIPPRQVVGLSGSSCMSLISSSCTVFPMCLHAWRPIGAFVSLHGVPTRSGVFVGGAAQRRFARPPPSVPAALRCPALPCLRLAGDGPQCEHEHEHEHEYAHACGADRGW